MFDIAQRIIIRNLCRKYLNELKAFSNDRNYHLTVTNDLGESLTLSYDEVEKTLKEEMALFNGILKEPKSLLTQLDNLEKVSDFKHIMINYTSIGETTNPVISNIWHKVCSYERTLNEVN